ncbi:hypothetical protein [Erwinia aphidicola]|uniref:hypothetical protein n=1 Tax=Erwinia aphidicola TaxID=68334 RepID=UPI00301B03E3
MLSQQIVELVMWIGLIIASPTLFSFMRAASALLWRRLFPTRKFQFIIVDEVEKTKKSVTLVFSRNESKTLVQLIDEAKNIEGRVDAN